MIVKHPDKRLYDTCKPCTAKDMSTIAHRLKEAFNEAVNASQGYTVVGIAAPQVGLQKQAFYAFGDILFNPKILSKSSSVFDNEEGCLSVEGLYKVPRSRVIQLQWLDKSRTLRRYIFSGRDAAIVQHELDHLQGKLICDQSSQSQGAHNEEH